MSKATDWGEAAGRQHRPIAFFAMIQCWVRGLDGIVLDRDHLERLLGLERFDWDRLYRIKEDFKDLFPFSKDIAYDKGKFGSLYLSRKGFEMPAGLMSDEQRVERILQDGGPRLGIFKIWPKPSTLNFETLFGERKEDFQALLPFFADFANYDERLLAAHLALLIQGHVSASSVPWLKPEEGHDRETAGEMN